MTNENDIHEKWNKFTDCLADDGEPQREHKTDFSPFGVYDGKSIAFTQTYFTANIILTIVLKMGKPSAASSWLEVVASTSSSL